MSPLVARKVPRLATGLDFKLATDTAGNGTRSLSLGWEGIGTQLIPF
jgi:hypothetical protein